MMVVHALNDALFAVMRQWPIDRVHCSSSIQCVSLNWQMSSMLLLLMRFRRVHVDYTLRINNQHTNHFELLRYYLNDQHHHHRTMYYYCIDWLVWLTRSSQYESMLISTAHLHTLTHSYTFFTSEMGFKVIEYFLKLKTISRFRYIRFCIDFYLLFNLRSFDLFPSFLHFFISFFLLAFSLFLR